MPLTDNQIKGLKPGREAVQEDRGGDLGIVVSPTGAKSFQTRYRFDGKEKIITHGLYPAMRLAEARALNEQTKVLRRARASTRWRRPVPRDRANDGPATASGVDRERLFATVADEWWDKKKLPTI